jgi:replication factor C subunit 2/4
MEESDSMAVDEPKRTQQKGFDPIQKKVKELMREGYSASQLLTQVF